MKGTLKNLIAVKVNSMKITGKMTVNDIEITGLNLMSCPNKEWNLYDVTCPTCNGYHFDPQKINTEKSCKKE